MKLYKTILTTDKQEYVDLWVTKEDAESYIRNAPDFDGALRAEAWIMRPDEHNLQYEAIECFYEYDVNGHYYYNVA